MRPPWAAGLTASGCLRRLRRRAGRVHCPARSQIRNARIWTATVEAAAEDAREGYQQALALHKRTRELKWQKAELERDIVECEDADGAMPYRPLALQQVQLEIARLENQEAIIDGFGVLSGRVKGVRGGG
jgi:DNA primase